MELNNNDEADNINRNLLNNCGGNNNNNNNNNNDNNLAQILNRIRNRNNIQLNEEEQEVEFLSKYSLLTVSFIIIFILNIIFWIIAKFNDSEIYKYVFEMDSIVQHHQYYRLISRYFIHFGIGHLILELFIAFFLLYLFENIYGSLFSIFFIIISMFINLLLQLTIKTFTFYYTFYIKIVDNSTINYEGGFAPILFALNTFLTSFDNNYLSENIFPIFSIFKASYSSFYALIIIAAITPNRSFIGNLSGILTGYFIRYFKISFLPKISWLIGFENYFKLNRDDLTIYRNITCDNIIMKKVLNQFEDNCIEEKSEEKQEENSDNSQGNDIKNNKSNNILNIEDSHEQIEMSFINNENSRNN
jgi:membrane associated rhomboid family serine protease